MSEDVTQAVEQRVADGIDEFLTKWGTTSLVPLYESVRTAILCETPEHVAREAAAVALDAFALLALLRSRASKGEPDA